MESNNPSCFGNRNKIGMEVQTAVDSHVEQEKRRLGSHIISVLNESEVIWNRISERQVVLHRLYAEQIIVSDKFTEYNVRWRDREFSVSENIATFHRCTEINEQVQLLLTFMEVFEAKVDRSGKIIRDAIREMRMHLAKLRTGLESVTGANTLQDLQDLNVPSLDWALSIPDPEIEVLAEEWDAMQLEPRMVQFIHELEILVQQNNDDLMDDDMNQG